MHALPALATLGFDAQSLVRAREEGRLVGRGEGFCSREWRSNGALVAVHTDAADREVVCAQPFLAGLPWEPWTLVSVQPGSECLHCATARVRSDAGELQALLPDFAARRKMFPVGLGVQASVVVIVEGWKSGAGLERLLTPFSEDAPGACAVGGMAQQIERFRNEATGRALVRCALGRGEERVWVVGPDDAAVQPGAPLSAAGTAVVRIGAPLAPRGKAAPVSAPIGGV